MINTMVFRDFSLKPSILLVDILTYSSGPRLNVTERSAGASMGCTLSGIRNTRISSPKVRCTLWCSGIYFLFLFFKWFKRDFTNKHNKHGDMNGQCPPVNEYSYGICRWFAYKKGWVSSSMSNYHWKRRTMGMSYSVCTWIKSDSISMTFPATVGSQGHMNKGLPVKNEQNQGVGQQSKNDMGY